MEPLDGSNNDISLVVSKKELQSSFGTFSGCQGAGFYFSSSCEI